MADTESIIVDADSLTFACEDLDPGQEYDVHYRYTDAVNRKFRQGSIEQGEAADSNGSLTVSYPLAALRGNLDPAHAATVHIWIHTLPPLTFDEEGNPDPAYDHNFGHVLTRDDGTKAEESITLP